MGVRNGLGYSQEQAQTGSECQLASRAVAIDAFSLDALEDQVGLAVLAHTGVEQAGDVGMAEAREKTCFVPNLRSSSFAESAAVKKLDGCAAFELAIAPAPEPHVSHAAPAEGTLEGVRTNMLACKGLIAERRALHEPGGAVGG